MRGCSPRRIVVPASFVGSAALLQMRAVTVTKNKRPGRKAGTHAYVDLLKWIRRSAADGVALSREDRRTQQSDPAHPRPRWELVR